MINLGELKKKNKTIDEYINNSATNQSNINQNKTVINLADVKSGKVKLTPLEEKHSHEYNLDGTRKIPSPMNMTNNNIITQGQKSILNKTMQNGLTNMLIKGSQKEQVDLSGKSYIKDTGKTLGEINKNATDYKDKKIYINEKNGEYFINENGKYKALSELITPTNVNTMSEAPKNDGDELLKKLSKKTGYTEDEVKSFIGDYNNAKWDSTKPKYRIAGDKFKEAGMPVFKAAKDYITYRPSDKKLSLLENGIKSTGNALIETGKGTVDFAEGILDTGLQMGSSKYNPMMWIVSGQTPWSKDQSKLNQMQDNAKEIIQKDASQNFIDNTLGYNKVLSDGRTIQETLDDGALIKSNNIGGKIFRGVGAQLPGLMTGSEGQSLALMGINSFGSGVEQAYNNGATRGEATTYGLLNAGIETATEKMFAGIGGVFGKGALDDTIKKGIEKRISNQVLKKVVDFGLDATGEGIEEVTSDLLQPIAQKLTYAKKEDILKMWKDQNYLEDFVSGALSSAVMQGMTLPAKNKIMNQAKEAEPLNNQNIPQNSNNMPRFNELSKNSINDTTNVKNGKIMPPIKYQYEQSDNIKINNLRKSASKYFNNSVDTKNLISTIEKVVSDKNYNVVFDNTIGDSINAKINSLKNGEVEIKINPNSNRAVEFLLMHEVTHTIETDSMKKLILNYASKNSEFNSALENLKKTYNTNDVSSEVVADISGQLFGNQEFINNLSMKEPNIFKKIYNKIIEIANKFTGNSRYDLFVKDLKNKWENAYRTQNNNVDNQKYHISPNISTDIDNVLNNISERNPVRLRDYTPKVLVENGIKDLPMYENPSHIRKNILTAKEAHDKGLSIMPRDHYHGLGKDIYIKAIDSLDNPRVIFKRKSGNEYLILTTIKDNNNNNIVVPIKIETTTNVNNIKIDTNRVKTVYGYDIKNPNLNDYIKHNLNNNEFIKIYEQKKERGTGNSTVASSSYGNNITNSNENVKLPTQYSMQNNQNNTQELDNSSFNLKEKQNEIIQKSNPAFNETSTWIRNADDIKTFEETLQDDDYKEYFETGEDFDDSYTAEMAKKALETGKITVYSSYPIEQGIFVSPSRMEAESYSGTGKVYSKEVKLTDIAWVDPTQGQYAKVDTKYSQNSSSWQEHLENNYKSTGTRTYFDEIKQEKELPPLLKKVKEINSKKTLDPVGISKLTKEDANTTPKLPKVERNTKFADKESSFYNNATEKSKFLTDESRNLIASEKDVQYYEGITNEDTLNRAYKKLQDGGKAESLNWFNKDSKKSTATDIAEGWILMKQYQDSGDYDSMVEVAKKMREIGTNAGQTVQAFNIMERLTPEGMVKYAQSELSEAYDKMIKNKTKEWIDNNRSKFDLTPDEVQFIIDNMKEIQNMNDGYDKRVKLAEIQKLMTDKLPAENGKKIKTWMRMSMLFNPKTQVRNIMGNAIIAPVNYFGDLFSSYADKIVAKKTGIRTTGKMNIKAILKGMKEGAYQATNDYKKGINTRDMEGNRFEIGEGKSFSDKNIIGRNLNRVDSLLNYVMDAGDRVFSQSSFENSLQNQMILNNTTEITQDMIDIARTESLQRTWNDNNNYTNFVLNIRKGVNKIGVKGYGLGDILIPFAKTPANLTKAIVDYSPVGLVNTIIEGRNLKKSLTNGQYTSKMQHQFVQDLGKATAGSMLYILGYALAKTKIITGESDDDKDVANFLKNTMGINSYSIKIGNKSFTYDWAQPIAAPLSIMANIVNDKYKTDNPKKLYETIIGSLDTGGSVLLEQSFLQSINDVLKDNDGVFSGLRKEILELPARAVPTFMKQIADMADGTQRQTFVKDKPIESAINSIKAKIPFVSKTLEPSVNTMGKEIKKYGGRNDIFNIFLNPANFNQENKSKAAQEIYNVYRKTGDKAIFPRVAPYSIDKQGLTTKQRTEYQKIGGNIVEKSVNELLKKDNYNKLSGEDKATIINNIVGYASNKAKSEILGIEMSKYWNSVNKYIKSGGTVHQFYLNKVVN